ncbi:hypothetical protein HYALB_00006725 [Hymenoscyphus albidus]|uniref:Uncharacterized protein n=1 Tax=Hymenoscyphus albidus TaxID=595503 RepID=A0A9N9PW59_9HELO|nr:hypothetical protein HYALB_00006725 [Hymenoscyphus albidus]
MDTTLDQGPIKYMEDSNRPGHEDSAAFAASAASPPARRASECTYKVTKSWYSSNDSMNQAMNQRSPALERRAWQSPYDRSSSPSGSPGQLSVTTTSSEAAAPATAPATTATARLRLR